MLTTVVDTLTYLPFQVIDLDGVAVEDLTDGDFTETAYLASTPATTATPEVTEVSDGAYVLSVTPDVVGTWYVTWSVTVDGDPVPYEETLQVLDVTPQIATDVTGASSVVNDEVTVALSYLDENDEPITGLIDADFTSTAYLTSDVGVVATVTVTELDEESLPGEYAATFRPTSVGRWQVKVDPVAPNSHELPPWREPVEVISLAQFDPFVYLGGVAVTLASPISDDGDITLYQGNGYVAVLSRQLSWSSAAWPNLTGATITFRAEHTITRTVAITESGDVVIATGDDKQVSVELDGDATNDLTAGEYVYQVEADISGDIVTLAAGDLLIVRRLGS